MLYRADHVANNGGTGAALLHRATLLVQVSKGTLIHLFNRAVNHASPTTRSGRAA